MSLNPKIWGPHAWFLFHSITLSYPECPNKTDKEKMKDFFLSLDGVLPCGKCRQNFKKHLIKHPLTDQILSNKKEVVLWLLNIHNEVNKINNKRIFTYDELIQYYNNEYSKDNKLSYIILVIILIIILLILFIYFYKNL
jgi:hypothetical protein